MIYIITVVIAKAAEIYRFAGIHTLSELSKIQIIFLTSELLIIKTAKLGSQMRYFFIADKFFCRSKQFLYLFSSRRSAFSFVFRLAASCHFDKNFIGISFNYLTEFLDDIHCSDNSSGCRR